MKRKKYFVKVIASVISLVLFSTQVEGQKIASDKRGIIGIALSGMLTADGYGGQYSPQVYFKKGRRSYFFGPIMQQQKGTVSGCQVNYDYAIVGEDACGTNPYNKRSELFCYINFLYQCNALLGRHAIWEEHTANNSYEGDVCNLHFKSVEFYAGAGLKIRLFKSLKWANSIGLGGYKSFDFPKHLYYLQNEAGLQLKTSISFNL